MALAGLFGCQKSEDHPPFAAGCEQNCPILPGIPVGTGSAGASSIPDADAGTGTLQGNVVLLTDDSFVHATLYGERATITADGASGSPVTTTWETPGPYVLEGVNPVLTNWVSVKPDVVGGEALLTYQAVQTKQAANVNLLLVSATSLDGIFVSVSVPPRSPNFGQVVLFFRSAGTGAPLAGLRVTMTLAEASIYAAASGWVLDDGTAFTDQSGRVVFGNVEPANASGTQTVTVTRVATPTTPAAAAGQFPVRVVEGAVTIATVDVQL